MKKAEISNKIQSEEESSIGQDNNNLAIIEVLVDVAKQEWGGDTKSTNKVLHNMLTL